MNKLCCMSQKRAWGLGLRSVLLLPLAFILLACNSMTCDPWLAVPSLAADSLLQPPNLPQPTPNSDPLTDGLVEELLDKPIAPNRDTSPQPSTPATKNPNSQPSNSQNKNSATKDPSTKDSVASGNEVSLDETLTESTQRLMRGDVSMGTQELQAKIVEQFDALIQAVDESQREQSKKKTTSKAGVGKGGAKSKTTKPPPGNQRDGGESQLRMTAQGQEPVASPATDNRPQGAIPPIRQSRMQ